MARLLLRIGIITAACGLVFLLHSVAPAGDGCGRPTGGGAISGACRSACGDVCSGVPGIQQCPSSVWLESWYECEGSYATGVVCFADDVSYRTYSRTINCAGYPGSWCIMEPSGQGQQSVEAYDSPEWDCTSRPSE